MDDLRWWVSLDHYPTCGPLVLPRLSVYLSRGPVVRTGSHLLCKQVYAGSNPAGSTMRIVDRPRPHRAAFRRDRVIGNPPTLGVGLSRFESGSRHSFRKPDGVSSAVMVKLVSQRAFTPHVLGSTPSDGTASTRTR